jgi:hypothetical protein
VGDVNMLPLEESVPLIPSLKRSPLAQALRKCQSGLFSRLELMTS